MVPGSLFIIKAATYRHLTRQAAKPRCVRYSRRKPRSANSVAAPILRRSVAASTASQRRARLAASQRHSANSVAAPILRRSVNRVDSAAALLAQRQRRSVAASQRHSVANPWQRRSVAASQRNLSPRASQRRSATRPRERHSATSETLASAPFAPPLRFLCGRSYAICSSSFTYQRSTQ